MTCHTSGVLRSASRMAALLLGAAILACTAGCGSRGPSPSGGGAGTVTSRAPQPAQMEPAPAPDVEGLAFTALDLGGSPAAHKSSWTAYSDSVAVSSVEGGLRCDIKVGDKREGYGGIRFATKPFKALRLDLQFDDPTNIVSVYVDGHDSTGRVVRWQWDMRKAPYSDAQAGPYILVPGKPSGFFICVVNKDISQIASIQLFVMAVKDGNTSFTLRKAEIAE
jgi:hypothetical protein